jgi:pimeloyl-ACP methyl ester carboxylesterase
MTHQTPTIVFIHGYLESNEVWHDFTQGFPEEYHLFMPNLPGYGPEARPVDDYSLEAAAQYLKLELDAARLGPVLLVGHSMGGYVALAFAEKHPGRVAGLCLFHSSAQPDDEEVLARRQRNLEFIRTQGVAAFAAEFLKPQLSPAHRESMEHHVAELQRIGAAVPLETALGSQEAMACRPDRRRVLERATYPVLFIAGKDDRAVSPKRTHKESLLPDHCTVLWLARVGHLGFVERPDSTRRAIIDFAQLVFGLQA